MSEKICFRYDGSPEAKEAIKLINKKNNRTLMGLDSVIYFPDSDHYECATEIDREHSFVTPSEFIRRMKGEAEWIPKYGEEVEVSDYNERWSRGKFLCFTSQNKPVVELPEGGAVHYHHIRPVRKSIKEDIVDVLYKYDMPHHTIADKIIELFKQRKDEL